MISMDFQLAHLVPWMFCERIFVVSHWFWEQSHTFPDRKSFFFLPHFSPKFHDMQLLVTILSHHCNGHGRDMRPQKHDPSSHTAS